MPSERIQRQIDRLLDEAEEAFLKEDWATVASRARAVLRLDLTTVTPRHTWRLLAKTQAAMKERQPRHCRS